MNCTLQLTVTDLSVDVSSSLSQPHQAVNVPANRCTVCRGVFEVTGRCVHLTPHLHQMHKALQLHPWKHRTTSTICQQQLFVNKVWLFYVSKLFFKFELFVVSSSKPLFPLWGHGEGTQCVKAGSIPGWVASSMQGPIQYEHSWVQYLARGYLGRALKMFWHLPLLSERLPWFVCTRARTENPPFT